MEQLEMFEFLQPVVPKQSESMLCCRCQHASQTNGLVKPSESGFFYPCRRV